MITCLALSVIACDRGEERENGLVNFYLVDAPGDFDEVWVEVLGVELVPAGGERLFFDYVPANKLVNVSLLVGDASLPIGRGKVPIGEITQMALILGDDIFVKRQGERTDMQYVSSENKRVEFITNYNVLGGVSYDIYFDIDLAKSVTRVGKNYTFNPVVRTFSNNSQATLTGSIRPVDARPFVYAMSETDTLTTLTNQEGKYTFRGLKSGPYSIRIQPRNPFFDTLFTIPLRTDTVNRAPDIQLRRPPSP